MLYSSLCVQLVIVQSAGAGVRELRPRQGHERRLGITQSRNQTSGDPLFPSILPPKPEIASFTFMLTLIPLTLWGAVPTTLFGEGVNLQFQLIKIPGCIKSV